MVTPLITFKAGLCDVEVGSTRPYKAKPLPEAGYIYLYSEDELVHFCWRKRDQSLDDPQLDLVMVPTDGTFVPYEYNTIPQPTSKTNGRIFALKFGSSSQRYLFWLQSKPQGSGTDPSFFSPRDRKIGDIVNRILQGEEVDVNRELASLRNSNSRRDDDDETMEDVEGETTGSRHRHGSGGAGADATGGDIREEGEGSREGGSDGARAPPDTAANARAAVQRFLDTMRDAPFSGSSGSVPQGQHADLPYPYLSHLLPTSITVPMINEASEDFINALLNFLPSSIILMAANAPAGEDNTAEPKPEAVEAAKAALSLTQKRALITRVLRSPQFHQALAALTMAIREGGLPTISEALRVDVKDGGYIQRGMPLGGGHAVKAFVDGITKAAKEQKK